MKNIAEGVQHLRESGLNLYAVLDPADLTERARKPMLASGVQISNYQRLILIGHGGRLLWDKLQDAGMEPPDPVDRYSTSLVQRFINTFLGDADVLWLYPGTRYRVPLQQCGETAGWSSPSPLGSGISPQYGLWFAYRAAFLTNDALPLSREPPSPSACDSCIEKPCIRACPADAVHSNRFEIEFCAGHRLKSRSSCADKCLSRNSCPVHPEHRYSAAQIRYHYHHSLVTLRDWYTS